MTSAAIAKKTLSAIISSFEMRILRDINISNSITHEIAEMEGFEPSKAFTLPPFQDGALNRYATSPIELLFTIEEKFTSYRLSHHRQNFHHQIHQIRHHQIHRSLRLLKTKGSYLPLLYTSHTILKLHNQQ